VLHLVGDVLHDSGKLPKPGHHFVARESVTMIGIPARITLQRESRMDFTAVMKPGGCWRFGPTQRWGVRAST
jgi:hypothetical protein